MLSHKIPVKALSVALGKGPGSYKLFGLSDDEKRTGHLGIEVSECALHFLWGMMQFEKTALLWAAAGGHADVVNFLLDKGAFIEKEDWVRCQFLNCCMHCTALTLGMDAKLAHCDF